MVLRWPVISLLFSASFLCSPSGDLQGRPTPGPACRHNNASQASQNFTHTEKHKCWQSVPATPSFNDWYRAAQGRRGASFRLDPPGGLRWKKHVLDALEVQAPSLAGLSTSSFWAAGQSLLDVGGGSGEIAFYLQGKYGISATVFDVIDLFEELPQFVQYGHKRKTKMEV